MYEFQSARALVVSKEKARRSVSHTSMFHVPIVPIIFS